MMTRGNLLVALATAALYAGTIFLGLRVSSLSPGSGGPFEASSSGWDAPLRSSIPPGQAGERIRTGALIFDETPIYASQYATAILSCGSCHAAGGIQPYSAPVAGSTWRFPQYSKRAGRTINLRDRIEECFVRSENGRPLPYDAPEMEALVDYIGWISGPRDKTADLPGRGLVALPPLNPDAGNGARVYAEQCAGCHGDRGQGQLPMFPPLWGPDSFNEGAGMNEVAKMAAFVQQNMPQNRKGILTAQEAFDVAAFIRRQPRPALNPAYAHF